MRFAILALIALFGLGLGFLVYRALIHSKAFAKLINGALVPTPETTDEVVEQLRTNKARAQACVGKCRTAVRTAREKERTIQRELGTGRRRRRPSE